MTRFSFEKWDIGKFLKGRKKMIVTLIGAVGAYVITQNPALAAIIGAATDMVYAIVDYYIQP